MNLVTIHATGNQGTGKTLALKALAKMLKRAGAERITEDQENHLLRFEIPSSDVFASLASFTKKSK